MLESKRQKKVIDYLHSLGAWTCKVITGNKDGIPDILACVPMNKEQVLKLFETQKVVGVFVAPEMKQPLKKPSALQKRNVKQIIHAGGISAGAITSVEDMKELLKG